MIRLKGAVLHLFLFMMMPQQKNSAMPFSPSLTTQRAPAISSTQLHSALPGTLISLTCKFFGAKVTISAISAMNVNGTISCLVSIGSCGHSTRQW